jgi:hypothetical protein
MLGKRFRYRQDTATRPEPDPRSWRGAGSRGEHPVEFGKAFDRNHSVAARHGIKGRVELDVQIEPARDTVKTDDRGPYRKSSQELGTLQRLGLLRQRRQAATDTAFPVIRHSWDRAGRQAAQIA